jgi:hypothetical protein
MKMRREDRRDQGHILNLLERKDGRQVYLTEGTQRQRESIPKHAKMEGGKRKEGKTQAAGSRALSTVPWMLSAWFRRCCLCCSPI